MNETKRWLLEFHSHSVVRMVDGYVDSAKEQAIERFYAWAAGYIDGEGCIRINRSTPVNSWRSYFSVSITVVSCERASVDRLQQVFGCGSISLSKSKNPKHRDVWRWSVPHRYCWHVLHRTFSYLVIKQDQASMALALYNIPRENELRQNEMYHIISEAKNRK